MNFDFFFIYVSFYMNSNVLIGEWFVGVDSSLDWLVVVWIIKSY